MEEHVQTPEEISLLDIIRLLFHKIKLLILVVLIGAVVGGSLAFLLTHNVAYYGTMVEFYVNPEKPEDPASSSAGANAIGSQYGVYGAYGRHVMDAIIKLLSSESFAEKLMLDGEPLPDRQKYNNIPTNLYDKATKDIQAANAEWAVAATYDNLRIDAQVALQNAWEEAGQIGAFTEYAYGNLLKNPPKNVDAEALLSLNSAYDDLKTIETERKAAFKKAEEVQKIAEVSTNAVLNEWRRSPNYDEELLFYKESTTYSYLGDKEDEKDANNLARSFIYVNINVLNEKQKAEELLERILKVIPIYVSQNMIVPSGYEGTSCTPITLINTIEQTNPDYIRNEMIKWALLVAFAAGVITAVILIIVDQSDKRLRNYEIIPKTFNVPVLGVVPSIEEMNIALEAKKKNGEVRK